MLFSINNREDLEELEELTSLERQVKAVRLQDKLGKQNFHEDMKKSLNHYEITRKYFSRYNKNYCGNF